MLRIGGGSTVAMVVGRAGTAMAIGIVDSSIATATFLVFALLISPSDSQEFSVTSMVVTGRVNGSKFGATISEDRCGEWRDYVCICA